MGTRSTVIALAAAVSVAGLAGLAGCSGEGADVHQAGTSSAADCAARLGDAPFRRLGWTMPAEPAESTVRGCHRESEQGYVEVRDLPGYARVCRTLDRSGGVSPGVAAPWVGAGVTACAVEPATDVGTTKVAVRRGDGSATLVTVAVLTATPRADVRAAVRAVL